MEQVELPTVDVKKNPVRRYYRREIQFRTAMVLTYLLVAACQNRYPLSWISIVIVLLNGFVAFLQARMLSKVLHRRRTDKLNCDVCYRCRCREHSGKPLLSGFLWVREDMMFCPVVTDPIDDAHPSQGPPEGCKYAVEHVVSSPAALQRERADT